MLKQNNIKLIYYTDAENQLFNLTSDPAELDPIQNDNLENELTTLLVKELGKSSRKFWKYFFRKTFLETLHRRKPGTDCG